jgi:hypothetical protein
MRTMANVIPNLPPESTDSSGTPRLYKLALKQQAVGDARRLCADWKVARIVLNLSRLIVPMEMG